MILTFKTGNKKIDNFLSKNRCFNRELIFLHPGSGKAIKAIKEGKVPSSFWEEKNWAKLADKLIKRGYKVLVDYTKEEYFIISSIIKKMKYKEEIIVIPPSYSIDDMYELISNGHLLISIDTGTVHVAAQTDIPIIDLFGAIDPKLCSPINDKTIKIFHNEQCNSCRKYYCPEGNNICMKAITVKEILHCVDNLYSILATMEVEELIKRGVLIR